ncbi:DUF6867 family protein [Methylobacterium sp. Leaf108]|uniref:DUF6867 family protein n=1 Tax=Methylobacterium sp. Leaf108 TaxID=1736256 RepID=UPI0006FE336A|nr:hypothetical protein [Methylobacterium sp. Leaf108]KQP60642.1 hypothetical protein ASF39_15905 [Methylobacterium sp. Leaf108]
MTEDIPHDLPTLWVFVLVTVTLGGGAAWMTGAGIARGWRPFWQCLLALLLVAAVARFLHYALFEQPLLSGMGFALDAIVILAIGAASYRATRTRQMTTQYRWLYERTGPLTWRVR